MKRATPLPRIGALYAAPPVRAELAVTAGWRSRSRTARQARAALPALGACIASVLAEFARAAQAAERYAELRHAPAADAGNISRSVFDEFYSRTTECTHMPTSAAAEAAPVPSGPWTGVDYVEVGAGPLIVLVHCSMSGARQWNGLMQALQSRFQLRAINLFGYGRTPAWPGADRPTLDDYADLVLAAVPEGAAGVTVIGHSFGGAVAMQAARRLAGRAGKLVLLEPSLFSLLREGHRPEAFAEIAGVAQRMQQQASAGALEAAAKDFITYWAGPSAWSETPADRRAASARAVALVLHEFAAAFAPRTPPTDWVAALPPRTLLVSAPGTTRAAREVVEVLAAAAPHWTQGRVAQGGHMAPITHAPLVNALVADFLSQR